MILGITGGTGCGKTTLLRCIADCGGMIMDCDAIYHDLLKTDTAMLAAIEARFPGTVEEGGRNLKKLGALEGDFRVCPGHGGVSTLARERQSNPYLCEAMGR